MMRFHERLANREAKAEAAHLSALALFESVEDFRERFGVDPHPGIGDFHL